MLINFIFLSLENTSSFKMSNAPNQYKASNDGEGEVYVPLTKNLKNMDLYDVRIMFVRKKIYITVA
jgi:hypothetical protein